MEEHHVFNGFVPQSGGLLLNYTIFEGDCVRTLSGQPEGSIDLTVFSPPYDLIRDYDNNPDFDLMALGSELYRVTKPGGFVAMVINDSRRNGEQSSTSFFVVADWKRQLGWRHFQTVIYERPGKPGAWWSKCFRPDHEYIHIFFKGDEKLRYFDKEPLKIPAKHAGKVWSGTQRTTSGDLIPIDETVQNALKCRGTVWKYASSNTEGNKVKMQHPATMPDAMARDLVVCLSKPGDTVLDPMCGSGTVPVMALKSGRRTIGIDISKNYYDLTVKRIQTEVKH